MELMTKLTDAVRNRVGHERYSLWFGTATRFCVDQDELIVLAPTQFTLDCLRRKFRQSLIDISSELCGRPMSVQFALHAEPAETAARSEAATDEPSVVNANRAANVAQVQSSTEPATTEPPATLQLVPSSSAEPRTTSKPDTVPVAGVISPTAKAPAAEQATARAATVRRGRKFAKLEEFIIGPGNRVAHGSAKLVAQDPGCISPLLVHGPTGVGKTHLLEGIWSDFRRQYPQQTAVYLSAEQFTTYFLEALRGTGLPTFRRKYRGVQMLIIDDLQFLNGKRATLVELLHTIDTLQAEGRQLVFAADRPAGELTMLGSELVSRLEGGMSCRVEPADEQTRLGILQLLATRRNLELPEQVAHMIAAGLTSHTRELLGAINRLQATSQALKQPITLALAREALGEMLQQSGRSVRLSDIERAVCDVFGLDSKSLHSNSRTRGVTQPRMLAMWLARKHTRAALSEIGQFFGCRAHSTVVSASKKVDSWVETQSAVRLHDREYGVGEALRRLEDQLRCG